MSVEDINTHTHILQRVSLTDLSQFTWDVVFGFISSHFEEIIFGKCTLVVELEKCVENKNVTGCFVGKNEVFIFNC